MSDPTNPTPSSTPDPEPEGVKDVQGEKVVPLAVLVAERERVKTSLESKHKTELDALKAKADKADKLEADLVAARPHLEYLNQHPELMKREEPPEIQKVSDEEAERYARHYELFTASGLDVARAKRMIADQRTEMRKVATEAATEAVKPMASMTAQQQSRQNFVWAAQEAQKRGVDAAVVAQTWAQVPPELSQHPEVAQLLLRASIGEAVFSGKALPKPPSQDPTFTEAPGGRRGEYQISATEKRLAQVAGIPETEWTKRAAEYQPDATNVLGD